MARFLLFDSLRCFHDILQTEMLPNTTHDVSQFCLVLAYIHSAFSKDRSVSLV